jgi:signal transduction histidine kinase
MVYDICNALEISKERNNNLTQFMRNFADVVKTPLPSKKEINIKHLVTKTANLMVPMANEHNINITIDVPDENIYIEVDPTQIEQVIINSIKNSIEAIVADGEIDIKLTNNSIIISDNGCGINDKIKSKLFTPFFSTKTKGQGVGLTLIREILTNHNMNFSLSTNEDHITKFVIHFNNGNK